MAPQIRDARLAAGPRDKVVADRSVEQGRFGRFDAVLIRRASNVYDMEIFMKLQFFFKDGDAGDFVAPDSHEWAAAEKRSYITRWHQLVRGAWNRLNVGTLADGLPLNTTFNFVIQDGGMMWDHFEVDVLKIPSTGFETSYVTRRFFGADVSLDSGDIRPKLSGQLAAVHEFGHMIGLPDEYKAPSAHIRDRGSIMHGGTTVRARHYTQFVNWAEANR